MRKLRLITSFSIFTSVLLWGGLSGATPMLGLQTEVDQIDFNVVNDQRNSFTYRLIIRLVPPSASLISMPTGWRERTVPRDTWVRWVFMTRRNINNRSMVGPGESLGGFIMSFNDDYPDSLPYALVNFDFSARRRLTFQRIGVTRTLGRVNLPLREAPIPEPTAVLLLGTGLAIGGLFGAKKRKKR